MGADFALKSGSFVCFFFLNSRFFKIMKIFGGPQSKEIISAQVFDFLENHISVYCTFIRDVRVPFIFYNFKSSTLDM